jgi:conjugative relaxase-like TrwC/TraI family protein
MCDGWPEPVVLTVKKILAGRGAVDYYLNQTRRGLADYYLPDADERSGGDERARLSAPGSAWWGGGAEALALSGDIERRDFVPLYATGARPGVGYLGRRFRLPEEADAAKSEALLAASEIRDPYERWKAKHEIRRKGMRASVAAWDCTFSPPKSVSLLWAAGDTQVQRQVWAAHVAAVDAGLGYLEEHAAYVRAGGGGVRVLDTTGLVVARMNEWTSRDGDMHLHTHCLLLNRAKTIEDGKWRALDGRALLAARTGAGALYNRTLEAELTRRLGVAWRDRPDGLREVDGIDDELIDTFSSRRRAITDKVEQLAAAYHDKYGIDPPPAVLNAMGRIAWSTTRQRKHVPEPADALEQWEATARSHGRQLVDLPTRVIGRARTVDTVSPFDAQVDVLLERLTAGGQATFTRHDLLRAALDVLPPGSDVAEVLESRASDLVDAVVTGPQLIGVSAPDLIEAPVELRRRDGTSVYEQPDRHRWTLHSALDEEAWLLDVALEHSGHQLDPATIETAIANHELGDDQADAVRELLNSHRRVGLLVGPAGAGKTRTLRAVVDAWEQTGRSVLGLTVSQAAAQVLSAEAQVRAENTAKWLHETRRGRWQLPDGTLVLVDEASMVSTRTLVDLVEQARRADAKVMLIGDPAQLAAIHIGGAFDLLADRHGASHLREIRRFNQPWEGHASQLLRSRDPDALAEYAMRARIHGGRVAEVEAGLFEAWQTDALTVDETGGRRSVLMIVSTNEQAAVLAEHARDTLIQSGEVTDGRTVRLRDTVASVGDHIVTRRNDRTLRTSDRGWVVNGDIWTIIEVYEDGAVDARRHRDGATITLPSDYLAEHCHLGYATTAHRAQGMTVDVCHAAITHNTSHEALYVAATRGRDGNHLWVATDIDRDVVHDPDDLPAPEHVLSRILERRDPDRLSAHQAIEESLSEMSGLARLGQIFEDAARTATDQWLRQFLADRGMGNAADDHEWSTLLATARQAALAGHDLDTLIEEAIRMRPMEGAHSTAAVLHWRVGVLADVSPPARARGPLASLPTGDGPAIDVARQAGELMRLRWHQIRTELAETTDALPWAAELEPQPVDPEDRSAWLTAATAVTAYRERFEVPNYTPMISDRPSSSRPDAQAAWDHARLQADRHLARGLHHLTDEQLGELDARQQAILDNRPHFNPAELNQVRQALAHREQARESRLVLQQVDDLGRRAARLEQAAQGHLEWRQAAESATAIRRRVRMERQRRSSPHEERKRAAR